MYYFLREAFGLRARTFIYLLVVDQHKGAKYFVQLKSYKLILLLRIYFWRPQRPIPDRSLAILIFWSTSSQVSFFCCERKKSENPTEKLPPEVRIAKSFQWLSLRTSFTGVQWIQARPAAGSGTRPGDLRWPVTVLLTCNYVHYVCWLLTRKGPPTREWWHLQLLTHEH